MIDRNAVIEMRNQGMTYAAIGKRLGISRQRVHQILNYFKQNEPAYTRRRKHRIIYTNIEKWLNDAGVGVYAMSKITGIEYFKLNNSLIGTRDFTRPELKALKKATKMTYDELLMVDES